jgi:hypothetical protein
MRSIALLLFALALAAPSALAAGGKAAQQSQDPSRGSQAGGDFGLYAEPFAGFGLGSFSGGSSGPVTSPTYSLIGPNFGGQIGVVYQRYYVAARLEYQLLNNSQVSPSPHDVEGGLVVGITLPSAPVRFWVGFNFVDNLGVQGINYASDSYLVGLGYLFSKIAVNFDLHFRSYAVLNVAGQGVQPTYTNGVISVSLPLTFSTPPLQEVAHKNSSTQKDAGSAFGNDWNI